MLSLFSVGIVSYSVHRLTYSPPCFNEGGVWAAAFWWWPVCNLRLCSQGPCTPVNAKYMNRTFWTYWKRATWKMSCVEIPCFKVMSLGCVTGIFSAKLNSGKVVCYSKNNPNVEDNSPLTKHFAIVSSYAGSQVYSALSRSFSSGKQSLLSNSRLSYWED